MDTSGIWSLAPAFDLTFANGAGWTRTHQMTLNSKASDFTKNEILEIGKKFSIKNPEEILSEVQDAFSSWKTLAKEHGVNSKLRDEVSRNLRSF